MEQYTERMAKNKRAILEEIKKPYRINPISASVVLIVTAFILIFIIGGVKNFERELTSDVVGAFISLIFAWNFGFLLYLGMWRFLSSRKINKVLFPKLERLIFESDKKNYEETEVEADAMVTIAYSEYKTKNNKLKQNYWTSFKFSFSILLIALAIEFVYLLLI